MSTEAHIAVTSLHLGRGSFEPGLDGQGLFLGFSYAKGVRRGGVRVGRTCFRAKKRSVTLEYGEEVRKGGTGSESS